MLLSDSGLNPRRAWRIPQSRLAPVVWWFGLLARKECSFVSEEFTQLVPGVSTDMPVLTPGHGGAGGLVVAAPL